MRSNIIMILIGCFFFSTFSVVALFVYTTKAAHDTSFIRSFRGHMIESESVTDLGYNSWYIAGSTSQTVYLGNGRAPFFLLSVNLVRGDTQVLRLAVADQEKYEFKSISVKIDSPSIILLDGTIPAIFKGTLGSKTCRLSQVKIGKTYFDQSTPHNGGSFVVRTFDAARKSEMLGKFTGDGPFQVHPEILERQGDGIFSVDGMLHVDPQSGKVIYVYFYRNQFIVMDSTLKIISKGRTIDTTRTARISIDTIHSSSSIMMSSPPVIVNKQSCISDDRLFVLSERMSKNERATDFNRSDVIDVYDLISNSYSFSFYMTHFKNTGLRGFRVSGTTMLALYDHYLVVRKLHSIYFQRKTIASNDAADILLAGKIHPKGGYFNQLFNF